MSTNKFPRKRLDFPAAPNGVLEVQKSNSDYAIFAKETMKRV